MINIKRFTDWDLSKITPEHLEAICRHIYPLHISDDAHFEVYGPKNSNASTDHEEDYYREVIVRSGGLVKFEIHNNGTIGVFEDNDDTGKTGKLEKVELNYLNVYEAYNFLIQMGYCNSKKPTPNLVVINRLIEDSSDEKSFREKEQKILRKVLGPIIIIWADREPMDNALISFYDISDITTSETMEEFEKRLSEIYKVDREKRLKEKQDWKEYLESRRK